MKIGFYLIASALALSISGFAQDKAKTTDDPECNNLVSDYQLSQKWTVKNEFRSFDGSKQIIFGQRKGSTDDVAPVHPEDLDTAKPYCVLNLDPSAVVPNTPVIFSPQRTFEIVSLKPSTIRIDYKLSTTTGDCDKCPLSLGYRGGSPLSDAGSHDGNASKCWCFPTSDETAKVVGSDDGSGKDKSLSTINCITNKGSQTTFNDIRKILRNNIDVQCPNAAPIEGMITPKKNGQTSMPGNDATVDGYNKNIQEPESSQGFARGPVTTSPGTTTKTAE